MFMTKWTMKEINYLRNNSYYDCVLELSNHSEKSIKCKLKELGISKGILSLDTDRYFDKEKIELLKKYYNKITIDELKNKLNVQCSNKAIYKKAYRLGLTRKSLDKNTLWSIKQYLINTYPNSDINELSKVLNVSKKTIYRLIYRLKLKNIINGNITIKNRINKNLINWYFLK